MTTVPTTNTLWDVCLGPMDHVTTHGSLTSTQTGQPCAVYVPAQRSSPLVPCTRYPMGGTIRFREIDVQQHRPQGLDNEAVLNLFERLPLDLNAYFAMIGTLDERPHAVYGRYYGHIHNTYPLEYLQHLRTTTDDPWIGAAYVARYLVPLQAWAFANRRFVVAKTAVDQGTSHLYGPCLAMFDEDNIIDQRRVAAYCHDSPVESLDMLITQVSYMTFCSLLHKRVFSGAMDSLSPIKSTFVCTFWAGLHFMPLQYDPEQVRQLARHSQVLPEYCTNEKLFTIVDFINNVKERTMLVPKTQFLTEGIGAAKVSYIFRLPLVMQHLSFGVHPIWSRRNLEHPHRDWLNFERVALLFAPRKKSQEVSSFLERGYPVATGFPLPAKWAQTTPPDIPSTILHTSCSIPSEQQKEILVHDWVLGRDSPDWLLLELNHFGRLWWLWYCRDQNPQGHEPDSILLTRPEDRRAYDCVRYWCSQVPQWCAAQLVLGFGIPESLAYRLLLWSDTLDGSYRLPHVSSRSMVDLLTEHRRWVWQSQHTGINRFYQRYKELYVEQHLTSVFERSQMKAWMKTLFLAVPSPDSIRRFLANPAQAQFDDETEWISQLQVREPPVKLMPMSQLYSFGLAEIESALIYGQSTSPFLRVQGQRPVPSALDQAFAAVIRRITSSIAVPFRKMDKVVRDYFTAVHAKRRRCQNYSDVELACVLLIQLCIARVPNASAHRDPVLVARLIQTLQQRYPLEAALAAAQHPLSLAGAPVPPTGPTGPPLAVPSEMAASASDHSRGESPPLLSADPRVAIVQRALFSPSASDSAAALVEWQRLDPAIPALEPDLEVTEMDLGPVLDSPVWIPPPLSPPPASWVLDHMEL